MAEGNRGADTALTICCLCHFNMQRQSGRLHNFPNAGSWQDLKQALHLHAKLAA